MPSRLSSASPPPSAHHSVVNPSRPLQAGAARAEAEAAEARDAHRALELHAAGLQRRVDRARRGGRQVAVEAEVMYQELSGTRECDCRQSLGLGFDPFS